MRSRTLRRFGFFLFVLETYVFVKGKIFGDFYKYYLKKWKKYVTITTEQQGGDVL